MESDIGSAVLRDIATTTTTTTMLVKILITAILTTTTTVCVLYNCLLAVVYSLSNCER